MNKPGIGRAILNGIIKNGLVCAESKGLSVWNPMTDEILEALVEDFEQNSKECQKCHRYAIYGEDENGFVCCDCLPPLEE